MTKLFFKRKFSYYDGYWQSYKYFDNFWYIFKNDFKFNNRYANSQILNKIKNSNSVAVHIRRGDYVNNSRTSKFHGNLDLKYYNKSIKFFENKFKNIKFFFSLMILTGLKKNLIIKNITSLKMIKKKLKCLLVI